MVLIVMITTTSKEEMRGKFDEEIQTVNEGDFVDEIHRESKDHVAIYHSNL